MASSDNDNDKNRTRGGVSDFPDPPKEQDKCRDFLVNFTDLSGHRKYFEQLVRWHVATNYLWNLSHQCCYSARDRQSRKNAVANRIGGCPECKQKLNVSYSRV